VRRRREGGREGRKGAWVRLLSRREGRREGRRWVGREGWKP